jgi:hypothetical protein
MTRSRRRVAEIAAALEALAEEHGIPAEIDPDRLRCRWYWEAQPSRDDH